MIVLKVNNKKIGFEINYILNKIIIDKYYIIEFIFNKLLLELIK